MSSSIASHELIRHVYSSFATGDMESMLGLMDDNVKWTLHGFNPAKVPFAGTAHGKAGVAEFCRVIKSSMQFKDTKLQAMYGKGDTVVVTGESKCIGKRSGESCLVKWAHVWNLENSKVVVWDEYFEDPETLEAACCE